MITTKLLLVVALVFAGIAQQECKRELMKIWLEYIDGYFVGELWLGTPEQRLKVTFDTERTDFWVIGPECTSDYCKAGRVFDSSQSSTFIQNSKFIDFRYRDTSGLNGTTGSDVIILEDRTIQNQEFIVVQNTSDFLPLPYDSLLGLAYYNDPTNSSRFLTPFENLGIQNPMLNTKIFSFILSTEGGVLLLGGVDQNYKSGNFLNIF